MRFEEPLSVRDRNLSPYAIEESQLENESGQGRNKFVGFAPYLKWREQAKGRRVKLDSRKGARLWENGSFAR